MDFRFVSKKPWVDETIRLRKALFFTTLVMAILGVILAIIGIILLAYMEFVVGIIAIIFGVLLPVGYFGANVLLFARRRKNYSRDSIIEYHFTEDALEIIKLTDNYKTKSVVSYSSFNVSKVYNKSRFVVLKTKNYYSDLIIIRKKDIVIEEGKELNQEIVSFVSFLMAKVAEANRAEEITCEDENTAQNEISGQNTDLTPENEPLDETPAEQSETIDTASVKFDDLTEMDEVVDIVDEKVEGEAIETPVCQYDVVEEDVALDAEDESIDVENDTVESEDEAPVDNAEPSKESEYAPVVDDVVEIDEPVDDEPIDDEPEVKETEESLFDYGETMVKGEDIPVSEPREEKTFFTDYSSSGEDGENK